MYSHCRCLILIETYYSLIRNIPCDEYLYVSSHISLEYITQHTKLVKGLNINSNTIIYQLSFQWSRFTRSRSPPKNTVSETNTNRRRGRCFLIGWRISRGCVRLWRHARPVWNRSSRQLRAERRTEYMGVLYVFSH